ncbi:MAG TPA: DNA-3-methyladenine glycosylase I [Candidatus Saccharimonadales bacterium]|nr:DNA-3-methyladenine glycosylase I [Candidatus Saccharimonadales bacterium]
MPKPDAWAMKHHKIVKPQNDNEYLERMSRVILASGLNWRVIENKWPGIKKAFSGFDVNKIAKFQEPEIEELMMNPDVIRNLAKIRAIVANAKTMQDLASEHGSFAKYLDSLDKAGGEDMMREQVSKRFAFLGKGTTVIFLFAAGCDLPKATAEWQARHQ